jgi:hypothetical protein
MVPCTSSLDNTSNGSSFPVEYNNTFNSGSVPVPLDNTSMVPDPVSYENINNTFNSGFYATSSFQHLFVSSSLKKKDNKRKDIVQRSAKFSGGIDSLIGFGQTKESNIQKTLDECIIMTEIDWRRNENIKSEVLNKRKEHMKNNRKNITTFQQCSELIKQAEQIKE